MAEAKKAAEREKEKKSDKILYTKDVADKLKVDPKTLRRILRTLPRYKSGEEYNRYTWDPDSATDKKFLASLPGIVEGHLRSEKKAAEKATAKKKEPAAPKASKLPPKKKAKKAAAKKKAPVEAAASEEQVE